VLFVGSYTHQPNVDAAKRLANSIMPLVRIRFPSTSLRLVGERPPDGVRRLSADDTVVTGRVRDVRPYLESAAVVVAPMRLGGGVRVKVLEALAAGKAVVATPLAVAGLDVASGRELLLGTSDEELAHAICSLLADPDERAAMGARARAWAGRRPGWTESIALLEQLYDTRRATPADREITTGPAPS
jgi:polysaccharide biosynthesis protein PslH